MSRARVPTIVKNSSASCTVKGKADIELEIVKKSEAQGGNEAEIAHVLSEALEVETEQLGGFFSDGWHRCSPEST